MSTFGLQGMRIGHSGPRNSNDASAVPVDGTSVALPGALPLLEFEGHTVAREHMTWLSSNKRWC
jgi:hypothetical protein